MPNTLSVGDMIAGQPLNALPAELLQFISDMPDGGSVIIVSFGSFMDYVPRNIAGKFCDGFRRLKTHRVIWKLKFPVIDYCSKINTEFKNRR